MVKMVRITGISALAFALMYACSTEKNTFINRKFHGMNAHYNGYFNANELLRQSMDTYRASVQEDYYSILPIDPMPNETDVVGMYPAIDTAISKCVKVITDHSMPGNDKPSQKKEEHNRWIDENWTTVGIAYYYRRDYDGAMKNFNFIKKFYKNDPSLYIGELWMAKTNIAQGDYTEAKFNLDFLDDALKAQTEKEDKKEGGSKSSDKKDKKEAKPAKFPKKIRFDFEKTKADLALKKGEQEHAIEYLEEALNHAKRSSDKARVHFILGQLYEEKGDDSKASEHYKKVLKGNAPFPMMFNARLKKAFLGGGSKKRKELNKMLRDAKNAEFKDQIYYALAGIEFNEGNDEKGVEYLHKSAFYSTTNTRQKGMAYEKLGDLRFGKRDYVNAQRYYDSCAQVINDTYPNAQAVRNKADNLSELVDAVETAYYEDSVQRIAAMSEEDREAFIKDVIKKIKDEEEARKKRDAERLRELQANQALFAQNGESGNKWYWYNAKTRAEGYDDFRKLWGKRDNEDDWRRSEKIKFDDRIENEGDSLSVDSLQVEGGDELTVESLSRDLPLTDSALAESMKRLLAAHYVAGIIYKEQLSEEGFAVKEFESVLERNVEDPHNVLAAFQLYKIHDGKNGGEADKQKMYILNNYPNSDYANYLRDPNFFVKKKEMNALAEQEYVTVLERYNRGLYYPVITKADKVINEEKANDFRAKYILLKAMAMGQTQEDKTALIPVLQMAIDEYPGTPEAERAAEMIEVIKNGYSENIAVSFENKYAFQYDDKAKLYAIVFLNPGESSAAAKTKIVDFNREFMSRQNLKVDSKLYGEGNSQSVVVITEFENESKAADYIRTYKNTRKHLLDLQNAKIMMITQDNLKILFQKRNLAEYEKFYEEFY
jgi:tetratricopeptide (TPR) repeat protein